MSDRYYLTDPGHVLFSGATGKRSDFGGKTTTANWWFSQMVEKGWVDGGLFFNVKGHRNIRGTEVRSLQGLAQSYRSGKRLFNYNPPAEPGDIEDLPDEFDGVAKTLRNIGGRWIVVADEVQDYNESQMWPWLLSQGGNLAGDTGFTVFGITQRPWNLAEENRNNLTIKIWVGPMTNEGVKYFKNEEMHHVADELKGEMKAYSWAVTDGGELVDVNPPVPEKFA